MILLIDNYDSFTYNLAHLLNAEYNDLKIIKNDEMTVNEIRKLKPKAIVISPGPGRPEEAGNCIEVIKAFYKEIPILGVCLGHQAIAIAFGGKVSRASNLVHGKTDKILHNNLGILRDVKEKNTVVRYHSLVIDKYSLPKCLSVTSVSEMDGQIMSIEHNNHNVFGLQFHPESYSTKSGDIIIKNFVSYINKEV
ncbi:MAG: aminodeoxychorismate/anthranilate synthase component II [Acidaminobacteraceae bacterium]